jgi:release factor glutamine methyltransferase
MNFQHQRRQGSNSSQRLVPARRFSKDEWISWRDNIFALYDRMRIHRTPYEVFWKSRTLTVLPDVYAPHIFTDSFWFAEQLPKIVGQNSLLEIGAGTGIISIACALNGARVVATDINPNAVENTSVNARRYGVDITARVGDVYSSVKSEEKFDYIFWAHPFNNWPKPVYDPLLLTGMDYQYQSVQTYLKGAKQHLNTGGKLLLGTGDTADLASILSFAKAGGYTERIIARETLPLEYDGNNEIEYLIYEFAGATKAVTTAIS